MLRLLHRAAHLLIDPVERAIFEHIVGCSLVEPVETTPEFDERMRRLIMKLRDGEVGGG